MTTISPDQIVAAAKKELGDPYVWGAEGPASFDCSGLVEYIFKNLGLTVPRTSQEQYKWSRGTNVAKNAIQPGDLVFFAGSDGTASDPGHVGIAISPTQMIHAPHTGDVVKVANIDQSKLVGVKRMPDVSGGSTGGVTQTDFTNPLGGLLSFPGEVTGFFSDATDVLTSAAQSFSLFFQPSTYIRIGAGLFGFIILIAALFFMIREAKA